MGVGTMMLFQIALAALSVTLEQAVQWTFGPMGILCLCLFAMGLKARNGTCLTVASVLLVMLVASHG